MKYKKKNIIYDYLKFLDNIFDSLFKDYKKFMVSLILGLLVLLVAIKFKVIFFTVFLIGLGAISMVYIRFFKYAHFIGFELCMMATVLTSLAYGPGVGALTGFLSLSGALILSGYFKPTYFISLLVLPLMGLIVPFFSELSLLQIGMLVTVIYDAVILPLYVLMGSRIISTVIFFITHVFLNYWIFTTLAPFIFSLM